MKNIYKLKQGFTLVELSIAMGILTMLIVVLTGIFGSIIDASLDANSTSGVDQDGRFIVARLIYDAQRASQIVTPSAPGATTSATLTLSINSVNYTYSLGAGGNLELSNNLGVNNLNSSTTSIQNLSFQRIGIGDTTDVVQVKFNVVSRIRENTGYEAKSFQTTVGLQ